MAVTIKDIARLANVSVTTVSRVINNKPEGVSEETRQKILKLVKELGYQPNAIARGLVTKKTKTIGLIIPDISNPFFPDIARGVEDSAHIYGYNVFLCNTDDNLEKESEYIRALKEKYVDGIIFTSSSIPKHEHIIELVESGIPVVIMDRRVDSENIYGVFLDNYEGGYIATKHLIDLGHEKIGCITGPLYTKSAKERLEGYKKALLDSGIKIDEKLIFEGDYKINGGIIGAERLLKDNKDMSAIFACNDLMAYGAYKTIRSFGYKIPDDISVVGFDDIQLSQILEPQLSTIKQPAYDMGLTAARMLIKLIEGKKLKKKIINFRPQLVIRQSTKLVKGG
ncbi:LacI family transcriptional regulator [Caldanaerobacter subterraneus subsp. tengcongensis MB4]|uniref:Transcriptional regulator n=3 Tax=Caldanaerobacter subterraneus TaxID=911092 RepID=Q8RD46_CALS4|nr:MULTISPECIES: LacI family DNA-binding transcriptional regulator [Caldanaerobacter]AAM23502.1 Transcriptional regulator [Caldanaerobacter subterraneus subsp. tengcongensis MB4]ERM92617.1 transcriptional regulator [Caldanaerobacter subterraneus subsp. yonseiensis KB-1]KKC30766.1 transcriptional regulator [Caldanaerobacter subterraneus subsp. pacificus DSM 12653]MCS3917019.1 LacI family transcriptional regulator [Caldanaerobacter subterraneus subsp. tengcongensis MB4]MDI3519261.1 LacI family t